MRRRPPASRDSSPSLLPGCTGIFLSWHHFMWAAHVHHALRVSKGVRRALEAGVSFTLVRKVLPPLLPQVAAPRQQ
jgi:hypothetical protein